VIHDRDLMSVHDTDLMSATLTHEVYPSSWYYMCTADAKGVSVHMIQTL